MTTLTLIKSLTLSFALMPQCGVSASVKDIIKSNASIASPEHQSEIQTSATYYVLPDNAKDDQQIVVIDAGHGGHDPGTHGKRSKEKDIALDIALELGHQMKTHAPSVTIIYTRDKDIFIPLHERIGLANAKKADLFISIHCNYVGNPDICGTETYVMGLHRAEDNLNVAKRENSVILLESEYETHYEGYDPNSPVGHILLSMIQNVFLDHSIALASKVEDKFTARKKTKSRGVKQAGFVVLRQATMPSILVETGFLSNPKEEAYLMSKTGQVEMASGIRVGIIEYLSEEGQLSPRNSPSQDATNNTSQQDQRLPPSTENPYVVQVGVFSQKKGEKYEAALRQYGNLIIEHDGSTHRYMVGRFAHKKDAEAIAQQLNEAGYGKGYIRKVK